MRTQKGLRKPCPSLNKNILGGPHCVSGKAKSDLQSINPARFIPSPGIYWWDIGGPWWNILGALIFNLFCTFLFRDLEQQKVISNGEKHPGLFICWSVGCLRHAWKPRILEPSSSGRNTYGGRCVQQKNMSSERIVSHVFPKHTRMTYSKVIGYCGWKTSCTSW